MENTKLVETDEYIFLIDTSDEGRGKRGYNYIDNIGSKSGFKYLPYDYEPHSFESNNCRKILYYLPRNNSPELPGLTLLPPSYYKKINPPESHSMVLKKYRIQVYQNGSEAVNYGTTATGFTAEEAIRKIAVSFTGSESLINPGKSDARKYPLTFKAQEIE